MESKAEMPLTASQLQQLTRLLEEKGHEQNVVLRPVPNLGSGYVEADLLDSEGDSLAKRVLFPT
jgi:hypothetical protein